MGWNGRYVLLLFDCLLVMGIYFCTDIPSALQTQIEMSPDDNCTEVGDGNSTCCADCLGLGATQYSLLYTVYSWTSSVMVLPVGFVIDRLGNRISAVVFTGTATIGSLLFAIGSVPGIRGTSLMFPLMMVGRLLIGAGTGSSRIVRDRVIASWFPDRLALAFGIAMSTMGLGSVLTFLLTSNIANWIGLGPTLFVGAGVCSTCFVSALCLCYLDWYGTKYHRDVKVMISAKSASNLTDIRKFPRSFWLISAMIATYYSFQLPFTANGSKFISERYGYRTSQASYINGVIYDVSVVFSPFAGFILDKIGNRGWVAFAGAILTAPMAPVLLFTDIPPLPVYIWLGVMFTFTVVALWSSIPHIVTHSAVGTANGIASCILDLTVGSSNLVIGRLLTKGAGVENKMNDSWPYVFLIMFGSAGICAACGIFVNTLCQGKGDKVNGRYLHKRRTRTVSLSTEVTSEPETEKGNEIYTIFKDIIIENKSAGMWKKYSKRKQTREQRTIDIDLDSQYSININIALNDNSVPGVVYDGGDTDSLLLKHYKEIMKNMHNLITKLTEENVSKKPPLTTNNCSA